MFATPLFASWRPVWDDEALGRATLRLDDLATQRNKGRSVSPEVTPEVLRRIMAPKIQAVLYGSQLPERRDFIEAVREVEPLVKACVWPRWLLLEHALNAASKSGDLQLAALVLRTQIEELDALRAVSAVMSRDLESLSDPELMDGARKILISRVLPRLQTKTAEQLVEAASDRASASTRPESLKQTFDSLSEYIHPNYGSHILCIEPHSTEAAKVLVDAFIAVYEAFFSLLWAKEVDDRVIPKEDESDLREPDLRSPFLVLAEDTIQKLAPRVPVHQIDPTRWTDAANCFRHCAKIDNRQDEMGRFVENGEASESLDFDVGAIRSLRAHSVAQAVYPEPLRSAGKRLQYALLVREERRLAENAERLGLPDGRRDEKAWLSLLVSSLTVAMNITEFKLGCQAEQAVRLINAGNMLGASLVVRSMLEHHAVAIELGKKLQVTWEKAERGAPSEKQVALALDEAEKQVARVLAGTSKPSFTHSRAWRTLWAETVRKPYHVLDPIGVLDKQQPGFLEMYGLLSHVVHGTVATGGDLLGTPGGPEKAGRSMLAQTVMFLADLCEPEAMWNRQVATIFIAKRLDTVRRDPLDVGARIQSMRLLDGKKLKPGRDIFGTGTAGDPYRFREGLLYHDAYNHYLRQEEIQVRSRRVESFDRGIGDRVEAEDGRVLHFLNHDHPAH